MAESSRQNDHAYSARAEVSAATLGAAFAAVTFTDSVTGDTFTTVDVSSYDNLAVMGKAATQDADVKVQVRNEPSDDWIDLAAETALTAGTAAEVYNGAIRYRTMQIVAKDTLTAGASVDVSFCLS